MLSCKPGSLPLSLRRLWEKQGNFWNSVYTLCMKSLFRTGAEEAKAIVRTLRS